MNKEKTPKNRIVFVPRSRIPRKAGGCAAMTLIEVTLALGVLIFALLPIVGLMGMGMGTLRDSMDETVHTGILRAVYSDLDLDKWSDLKGKVGQSSPDETYFTESGNRQSSLNDETLYIAKTTVVAPSGMLASSADSSVMVKVEVQHRYDSANKTKSSRLVTLTQR